MADRTFAKAYKAWVEALENMRAAIAANPLVADPLMASAQVFEDVGRMMFGGKGKPKKRAPAKKAAARKKPSPRARARKG